jgi:hypothetical protein
MPRSRHRLDTSAHRSGARDPTRSRSPLPRKPSLRDAPHPSGAPAQEASPPDAATRRPEPPLRRQLPERRPPPTSESGEAWPRSPLQSGQQPLALRRKPARSPAARHRLSRRLEPATNSGKPISSATSQVAQATNAPSVPEGGNASSGDIPEHWPRPQCHFARKAAATRFGVYGTSRKQGANNDGLI